MVFSIVWGSKKEKIKINVCLNTITEGGLGMVDLQAKVGCLRLSWIRRLFDDEKATWGISFSYW